MKKVFLFLAMVAIIGFSSCTGKQAETAPAENTEAIEQVEESVVVEEDTTNNTEEVVEEVVEEVQ